MSMGDHFADIGKMVGGHAKGAWQMSDNTELAAPGTASPFERICRTNEAGAEYWSSRDFAGVLGYTDYRNFEQVVGKARLACFNSGQRIEDHFVDITEMIESGSGAQRPVKTVLLSRCAAASKELDFIINYDIKYRMGLGEGNGEEIPKEGDS